MFEINVVYAVVHMYKKQRLLYLTLRTAGHRKWDTYGVHTTGKKLNLMRSHGKKGGIDQASKKSFYQKMLKHLALQSVPAVSDTINIEVEMAPDEDF